MRRALMGCLDESWMPPSWLYPHQRDAAQRLIEALRAFSGALLADQVGLGKTYVALALATTYDRVVVAVPATLKTQWRRVAMRLTVALDLVSHEALSRGTRLPDADLVIVDEAHRFRNPNTRRYDTLARSIGCAHLLLVSATPVVNRAADLIHLVRLFLADNALAPLGVPSLEHTLSDPNADALMHAIAPFVVGRSVHTVHMNQRLPRVRDHTPIEASPIPAAALAPMVRSLEALRFPSFGREASALLRLHLYYRLASSADACLETLHRHRLYLDHATDAAHRGERLSRGAARRVFGRDEGQLALGL